MGFLKSITILIFASTLVACGGSGGGSSAPTFNVPLIKPFDTSTASDSSGLVTVSGKATPNSEITVTFPDGSKKQTTADSLGKYLLVSDAPQNTGSIKIDSETSQGNTSSTTSEEFTANLDSVDVLKALYKSTGEMPALTFEPSLGINTEAPQGGVDTAGMPMPFADIFRTARPFGELSLSGTAFDDNGWPIKYADEVNFVRTKLLQGAMGDSIPEGMYTVIYDGEGTLEFGSSGSVDDVEKVAGENK